METLIKILGGLVLFIAALIGAALLGGVVIQDAWGWFLVPLGLPPIKLAHAIGLSMIVGYFKMKVPTKEESDLTTAEKITKSITGVVMVLMAWGMMAITARFM